MKELQSVTSSIIEISSKGNVSKEITMVVHKIDIVNANGLDFKLEYVEKFKDTLVNKPIIAKYLPLTDDLGDHEPVFDSEGNIIRLETIAIGTIKEVWIDDLEINSNETVKALYAKADLWNYKYPEIISCVQKLFDNDNADSSVEVEIYSYGENPSQEYRYGTDFTYIGNCLLGEYIDPADNNAGVISVAQKEIAQAVKHDLDNIKKKGDMTMEDNKELFNKGYETKFDSKLETSALKFSEIRDQVYNLLNPVNPQTGSRTYNHYIRYMYDEYAICEDWNQEEILWKIPYSISNNVVSLAAKDQWQQGKLGFIPDNSLELSAQLSQKETELNSLQDELNKVKEELNNMDDKNVEKAQELETTIKELNSKIEELEGKVTELNSTIVEQEEAKTTLEGQVTELNSKVEELTPFKEQVEKAEKDVKVAELSSKYEKLMSEEMFKSEDVQKAIQELNSTQLNEIVVSEVSKQKTTIESASKKEDGVTVLASKQDDLISPSVLQKYGFEG